MKPPNHGRAHLAARPAESDESSSGMLRSEADAVNIQSPLTTVKACEVAARCQTSRLVAHHNSRDKNAVMERLFAIPGRVLISPSSREGLDLYADRSRFPVIAKLPFASLGDKVARGRMNIDRTWCALRTTQKLIQACGRSIRSEIDFAATYLVDVGFGDFTTKHGIFFCDISRNHFESGRSRHK